MKRVYALAMLLSVLLAGPAFAQVYYYSSDTLHSEVVITDASRNVVERTYYAPYGQVLNRSLRDGPGYTGQEEDPETSLVYMQQRYYDPESGRFLSNDPVATMDSGGGFNRYVYANDNPYRFTDPTGEISWEEIRSDVAEFLDEASNDLNALGPDGGELSPVAAGLGDLVRGGEAAEEAGQATDAAVDLADHVPEAEPAATKAASKATTPYKRPSGATTRAQRASVQGKPCVKCGDIGETQVAGHKKALVQEYHETGTIDKGKMRSVDAVQPECSKCSAQEGAEMARYSQEMNKTIPPPPPPKPPGE